MTTKATTVRVDTKVKREIDRLQGAVAGATGEKVSHSELLARLVRFARRHEDEFVGHEADVYTGPTIEQIRKMLSRRRRGGPRTDSRKIDEVLYGGRP